MPDPIVPGIRALSQYETPERGQAGITTIPYSNAYTTVPATAGQARYGRVVPTRRIHAVSMCFVIPGAPAAAVGDNVDLTIFASDLATRLATTGARAGYLNSTGAKSPPLVSAIWLQPGTVYYFVINFGTLSGAVSIASAGIAGGAVAQVFGTTAPNVESGGTSGVTFPTPNGAITAVASSQVPFLGAREF